MIDELQWALANTIIQYAYTFVLAIVLGSVIFFGLTSLPKKFHNLKYVLMLPTLLPSLYIVSAFLPLISLINFGSIFVGLVQGAGLSGFVALRFFSYSDQHLQGLEGASKLMGATKWKYYKTVFWLYSPIYKEAAILSAIFSVTSFAIPFVFGGGQSNLEIYIYEQLKMSGLSTPLFLLSLGQFMILMIIAIFFQGCDGEQVGNRPQAELNNRYRFYLPQVFVFGYIIFYLISLVSGLVNADKLMALLQEAQYFIEISEALINSLIVSFVVSLITFALLFGLAGFVFYKNYLVGLKIIYSPSTAVVGVMIWAFMSYISDWPLYVVGLLVIFMPNLLKMGFIQKLESLKNQTTLAQLFGASKIFTLRRIIWPQMLPEVVFLSSLAWIWSFMDFSLAAFVIGRPQALLGSMAQSWVSSYHLSQAQTLISFMILFSITILGAVNYVVRKH